ncbi:bifunctional metallophosphatase/5'-nucleotidase [Viridibacillus sp. YIM B01967]|uniref:Bifunctional metallophosphatase/5'-nucleotidase n=1 Tax=Viridibacillus soli TaxID=2798301 RepID=A0ABS1H9R8_9BACL|nr:bifunctional UDP-sugar hydrolase/5'-nucleotidase [Viridibacillus soli]MBK3496157.1 bifunctional metallophosphatase/5'-nucleotidase [Viridibacillus soli]
MFETIHFYHTNDVHSHFEHWPRIHKFLVTRKEWHIEAGDSCFVFDIGDYMDRSNVYSEATLGKGNVKLLNDAKYDAVTIGNNEGITLSNEDLNTLYNEANFDVILANLRNNDGSMPTWAELYHIYTTKAGTKVGVIAATAPFTLFYKQLDWEVMEPIKTLQKQVVELRDKVDVLVCMSHLGLSEDTLLAELCPEIDVIFGSHTHHILHEGKIVNDVLLTGGGKFGFFVGHTEIQFDTDALKVVTKKTMLHRSIELAPVEGEVELVASLERQGHELLDIPVFYSDRYYNKEWYHHSNISRLFAKALLQFAKADCALFNAGIFLTGLPKGRVTANDIHSMLPHPINACVIELTGEQLREVYFDAQNGDWPRRELKGLGFRGVVFGKMLNYRFEMDDRGQLVIEGKVADLKKSYKLVTLDMYTFGYFFPNFKNTPKTYLLPQFLRDILIQYGLEFFKGENSK